MKAKTKFDLSGVRRFDAGPLRQHLKLFCRAKEEIAGAKANLAALQKEVDEFLDNTDPGDAERLKIISAKQLQLQILPRMIQKVETRVALTAPDLAHVGDALQAALLQFYADMERAVISAYTVVLGGYFTAQYDVVNRGGDRQSRAAKFAAQTDECLEIRARMEELARNRLGYLLTSPRSNDPEHYDKNLVDEATALLALADRPTDQPSCGLEPAG